MFFTVYFVSVLVVHLFSSIETATVWKKFRLILSKKSDFHKMDNLLIAVNAFDMRILRLLSIDEIWLLRNVNWSTNLRELPLNVEVGPYCLKHINSVLFAFMPPAASSRFCCWNSASSNNWLVRFLWVHAATCLTHVPSLKAG